MVRLSSIIVTISLERGSDDPEGGPLSREGAQDVLQADHPSEVGRCQQNGERPVDERTVDDEVYVVEVILEDEVRIIG